MNARLEVLGRGGRPSMASRSPRRPSLPPTPLSTRERGADVGRPLARVLAACLASALLFAAPPALAEEESGPGEKPPAAGRDLSAQSLPLRTALHHDPTLAAPLDRLLEIYRSAGAVDELLGLYRAHVAQYPDNLSGQTVLVRLLATTGNPEALPRARDAAARFAGDPYARFLLFEILRKRHDPKALDELDKAIELQKDAVRKTAWVDVLVDAATVEGRRELAQKHLAALAALAATPEARLEVARRMNKHRFYEPALQALRSPPGTPSPETAVDLELESAAAEVGLDRMEAAAARLDRLLGRLAGDYWRRGEIVARRLTLVKTQAERDTMLAAVRKRVADQPSDEAAAIDLAEMLAGFQLRREALAALLEAGARLPKSAQIEQRTLDLFDRLRDERGREEYLSRRIKANPGRDDLLLLRIKGLFLLGRSADARAALAKPLAKATPADRVAATLELARFLRRAALAGDAVEMFREVVRAEPTRLDVRRELAETHLALGERDEVRKLFEGPLPPGADLENVMDLVQFMVQQKLFAEARGVLVDRVAKEKTNLEVRTLLLNVYRRLGDEAAALDLIAESRKLADTNARYRLWLEAAAACFEDFTGGTAFFAEELARLDEQDVPWADKGLERRLALADVAARAGLRQEVADVLREGLQETASREGRVAVRRRLIAVLEGRKALAPAPWQPGGVGLPQPGGIAPWQPGMVGPGPLLPASLEAEAEIRAELEALAKDAPEYADECNARLAVLYAAAQRADLAWPLIGRLDVTKIQDPSLLGAIKRLYQEQPSSLLKTAAILERLIALNPGERVAWQEWLMVLAIGGEDTRLSTAIRRLLAGVDKMPLSDATRRLLEQHLADCHWRSIGRRLADGGDASLAEALPVVDALERMASDDQEWLWIAWTRAYLLNRLGRTQARDEAIRELDRVAARVQAAKPEVKVEGEKPGAKGEGDSPDSAPRKPGDPPVRIAFPDGLTISLAHARKLLTSPSAPAATPAAAPRQGPLPPLKMNWIFATDRRATVAAILPLDDARVMVCDRAGTAYGVDAATGKLLWRRERIVPTRPSGPQQDAYGNTVRDSSLPPSPPLSSDGKGRFFVPGVARVSCFASADGRLLWKAIVGPPGARSLDESAEGLVPYAAAFLCGDKLVAYEPLSGTVAGIDPATGKIALERTVAADKPLPVSAFNAGASLSGDRVFVYGAQTAILDATTGEVEWLFEPDRVRQFPVKLEDPAVPSPVVPPPGAMAGVGPWSVAGNPNPFAGPYAPSYLPAPYVLGGYRPGSPSGWRYGVGPYSGPNPFGPSGLAPQYLNYTDAAQQGMAIEPGTGVRLAPAIVAWAAAAIAGSPREACLVGPWLVLSGENGADIVRTDLPLRSTRAWAAGEMVGVAGRWLCVLAGENLYFMDVTCGMAKSFDISGESRPSDEYAAERPMGLPAAGLHGLLGLPPAQVAVDGAFVYITGPKGIRGVNAASAQQVFECDWPAEAGVPKAKPGQSLPPGVTLADWMNAQAGTIVPGASAAGIDPSAFEPLPVAIARARGGTLYTLVAPDRVIALTGSTGDGR